MENNNNNNNNNINNSINNNNSIAKYNKINNLSLNNLTLGYNKLDLMNVFIFCNFSYATDQSLYANTYLGKNLPDLNKISLDDTNLEVIIIVTLFPEYFSLNQNRRVLVISIINLVEEVTDLMSELEHSNSSMLFIFHGIKWSHIIQIFKLYGIYIQGTKNSIRHVVNNSQINLFQFLYLIYGSFYDIQNNLVREPTFSKYWIGSKTTPVLYKAKNSSVVLSNITSTKFIDEYLNIREKYVFLSNINIKLNKLLEELNVLDKEIKSLEEAIETKKRDLDHSVKGLEVQISNARSKKLLVKSEKLSRNIVKLKESINSKVDELLKNKKEILKTRARVHNNSEILKKERVIQSNLYSSTKDNFFNYLNSYASAEADIIQYISNSIDNIVGDVDSLDVNKIQTSIQKPVATTLSNRREYSTNSLAKYSRVNYTIENSIYMEIYKYIVDANMPENSSNPVKLENIQLNLELFLNNQARILYGENLHKKMAINPHIINSAIRNYFLSFNSDLHQLLKNLRKEHNYDLNPELKDIKYNSRDWSKLISREQSKKVLIEILSVITRDEDIILILMGRLLKIISNKDFINENSKSSIIHLDVGRAIYFLYREILYNAYRSEYRAFPVVDPNNNDILNTHLIFEEFKSSSVWTERLKIFNNDIILHNIGAWLVDKLIESRLIVEELQSEVSDGKTKQKVHVLRPCKDIINILNKYSIQSPYVGVSIKLPMLVPPREYTAEDNGVLGGYLLNGIKYDLPLIIENPELKSQSKINAQNNIYNMVNYTSRVGFKINAKVLDFILEHNNRFNFLIDPRLPLTSKVKLNIKDKKELASYNSEIFIQGHIIRMAITYRDINKFYFPNRIDNRGRLYVYTDYLNYQGSELAKALLLFSDSARISKTDRQAIEYLKYYGANLYGNGLKKLSLIEKLNWVRDNESDIINYENGILLAKAENKYLFLAFCIEYCSYLNSLNNNLEYWFSDFPIQVDATCNGYQHLALLLGDNSLAEHLNLKARSLNDKPEDFYSFVAINLKELFKEQLSQIDNNDITRSNYKENYERLYNLNIQRSLIKKPIMTKPYNVTIDSMTKYILEDFVLESESLSRIYLKKEEGRGAIWYEYKKDPRIKLTETDINILSTSINYLIYKKFPRLLLLTEYFKNVAKFCNALKISIPWLLPNGIEIDQEYLKSQIYRVKPFTYKKSTYNLMLPDTKKINNVKQIRALMPNLIHSLDAASLALVIEIIGKNTDMFYSVHDCFASTANNIDDLINDIRLVYYSIYSQEQYLLSFDKYLKEHIANIANWDYNKSITVNKKRYTYPNIQEILKDADYDYKELLKSIPVK